ncbi:MAG: hypothetical protein MZV65_39785 [Chromatiales bacterium]|nr:hypothetical protein [Chromatiales bacterium]
MFAGVENVSRASFSWNNLLVGLDVVRRYIALAFLRRAPVDLPHGAVCPPRCCDPLAVLNVLWMLALGVAAWRVPPAGPARSRSARSGSC